jgi:hypothetical protein
VNIWKFLSVYSERRALDSCLMFVIAEEISKSIFVRRVDISLFISLTAVLSSNNDLSSWALALANLSSI